MATLIKSSALAHVHTFSSDFWCTSFTRILFIKATHANNQCFGGLRRQVAGEQDNLARAANPQYATPMTQAELDAVAESEARRWFHQRALEEAETQAAAWYRGHWAGIRDMARAFPEGHVRRFEAQYPQYNLTRIFGLSPRSGLSNFLSCYPKDPMYLKPLTFDEEGQPVRSVDGTIAGGLLRILESHPPVALVSAMPVRTLVTDTPTDRITHNVYMSPVITDRSSLHWSALRAPALQLAQNPCCR